MMFLSKLRVVASLVRLRQSLLALPVPCWRWAKIIEHLWDRKDFLPEIPEWLRGRKLVWRKLVKPLNIPNVEVGILHVWFVFFCPPSVSGIGLYRKQLLVFICCCRFSLEKVKRDWEVSQGVYVFRILPSVSPSLVSLICMELGIVGMIIFLSFTPTKLVVYYYSFHDLNFVVFILHFLCLFVPSFGILK